MGNFDFESGKRFIEEGELAEGIRCFLASLDQDPSNVEAYMELFKAYELAWHESGDSMVLDQMRKVVLAGLKRHPTPEQQGLLQAGLDRTDAQIIGLQQEEEHAEREEQARARRLPIVGDDAAGGGAEGDS